MKKFVHKPRAGAVDTGPITITASGGLPQDDPNAEEAAQQVRKLVADGRRVTIYGGLPDVLQGEQMTPEQRKAHDDAQYAAAHGQSGTSTLGKGV
ncbi:hypothetical protein DR64_3446 [Paraburkholderia xenovorans LB400]|nr:hypothetical protein DR64_3446 [Paraburkholderia xenovorans LB400]